jgi:formate hydrogenlyase subunit 6/NADH:ubiquinone oxidoreductase subunit I
MSIWKPFKVVMKNLFQKPMTLQFPYEKLEPVEGYRGRLLLDLEKCIGCGSCVRACPNRALELVELSEEFKEKNPHINPKKKYPKYYQSRCGYCALCVESCPVDALQTTPAAMISVMDKSAVIYSPEKLSQPE